MPDPSECRVSWNGADVAITARTIPRWAWNTASIDVAVNGRNILRTGGVFRFTGKHIEHFDFRGSSHVCEIAWGMASLRYFPFSLNIDGLPILKSRVPIQNWWYALWPWVVVVAFLVWRRTT